MTRNPFTSCQPGPRSGAYREAGDTISRYLRQAASRDEGWCLEEGNNHGRWYDRLSGIDTRLCRERHAESMGDPVRKGFALYQTVSLDRFLQSLTMFGVGNSNHGFSAFLQRCLLYTSDAADE